MGYISIRHLTRISHCVHNIVHLCLTVKLWQKIELKKVNSEVVAKKPFSNRTSAIGCFVSAATRKIIAIKHDLHLHLSDTGNLIYT